MPEMGQSVSRVPEAKAKALRLEAELREIEQQRTTKMEEVREAWREVDRAGWEEER